MRKLLVIIFFSFFISLLFSRDIIQTINIIDSTDPQSLTFNKYHNGEYELANISVELNVTFSGFIIIDNDHDSEESSIDLDLGARTDINYEGSDPILLNSAFQNVWDVTRRQSSQQTLDPDNGDDGTLEGIAPDGHTISISETISISDNVNSAPFIFSQYIGEASTFEWTLNNTKYFSDDTSGGTIQQSTSPVSISGYIKITYSDNAPLPVELSTFEVTYADDVADLNWITQSETDSLGWNVYRSISQNLGQAMQLNYELIPGAGTTTEPTYYNYIDNSLQDFIELYNIPGGITFWYWIENVDNDGETTMNGPAALEINEEIDQHDIPLHKKYGLYQNNPNPFNPGTAISFNLDHSCYGELKIYDIKGRLVRELFTGQITGKRSEDYSFYWDGLNEKGEQVASGIYLYRLRTDSDSYIKKMLLTK